MPPHCDALDGPVVTAARTALSEEKVELVLPYVHADGESEVRDAFDQTVKVAAFGDEARELAERWFFETVVRVHRSGENAPYTGLKSPGLDEGQAIPAAVRALETGIAEPLTQVLCTELRAQVEQRLDHAIKLQAHADADVSSARRYVEAALGLQVWANAIYRQLTAEPHRHLGEHEHG